MDLEEDKKASGDAPHPPQYSASQTRAVKSDQPPVSVYDVDVSEEDEIKTECRHSLPIVKTTPDRPCGPCTGCCEGWLSANIRGHEMHPGRPCFFLSEGKCSDYENRPGTCRIYNCAWKVESNIFPEWMRPDASGVIISKIVVPLRPELTHYEVAEARGKLDVKTLNWLVQWSINGGHNLFYQIEGKHHALGTEEFCKSMKDK